MKKVNFRTLDDVVHGRGRVFTGNVKNPAATVGSIASRIAAKAGLAGGFEIVEAKSGKTISPDVQLKDIPDNAELALAPEFTPACS